jgi:hypothetical protein
MVELPMQAWTEGPPISRWAAPGFPVDPGCTEGACASAPAAAQQAEKAETAEEGSGGLRYGGADDQRTEGWLGSGDGERLASAVSGEGRDDVFGGTSGMRAAECGALILVVPLMLVSGVLEKNCTVYDFPETNPDKSIVALLLSSPMTRSRTVVQVWGLPTAEVTLELPLPVLWKAKPLFPMVMVPAPLLPLWATPVNTTSVPPTPPTPLLIVVVEPLKFTPS